MQSAGVAAQGGSKPGTIKGQVLVADSTGSAYVPGTLLVLNGPENLKAESDANGQFNFPSIPPGNYTIEANAPGLEGQLSVTVDPGQVAEVSVKLDLAAITSSVTVNASAPNADITTATQTVEEKTIADAPNSDQRFETLLPSCPRCCERSRRKNQYERRSQHSERGPRQQRKRHRSSFGRTSNQPANRRGFVRPGGFESV